MDRWQAGSRPADEAVSTVGTLKALLEETIPATAKIHLLFCLDNLIALMNEPHLGGVASGLTCARTAIAGGSSGPLSVSARAHGRQMCVIRCSA
jgi:hypothetical protein